MSHLKQVKITQNLFIDGSSKIIEKKKLFGNGLIFS